MQLPKSTSGHTQFQRILEFERRRERTAEEHEFMFGGNKNRQTHILLQFFLFIVLSAIAGYSGIHYLS